MGKKWALVFLLIIFVIGIFLFYDGQAILNLGNGKQETGDRIVTASENLTIYFLNVSQGDSSLFVIGNKSMLIDCGEPDKGMYVSGYIMSQNISRLNYLIITHTDADHMGGCATVLRDIIVGQVIVDGQIRDTKSYNDTIAMAKSRSKLVVAGKNDEYNLGWADFKVVHANSGSSDPNQNSIVLMMSYLNFAVLMDADCDNGCETSLLDEKIAADVLKVAHHGSRYASMDEFITKVNPKLAVISVGQNNYGHPSNETLGRLEAHSIEIMRTDLNGTVIIRSNGNGYWIGNN